MAWFSKEQLRDSSLPWIAVRTRVRSEKQAAAILSRWGADCWAPTAPLRRKWSDRWKTVDWPMFPGYLFARIPPDGWYPLLDIPGVHTVVKAGRLAAVIDTATVDDVRAFALRLGAVECAPERVPWYQPGDLVVVTGGPFQGLRAAVSRVGGRECVTVGLTLLGQAVAVTMPDWQLERLAS